MHRQAVLLLCCLVGSRDLAGHLRHYSLVTFPEGKKLPCLARRSNRKPRRHHKPRREARSSPSMRSNRVGRERQRLAFKYVLNFLSRGHAVGKYTLMAHDTLVSRWSDPSVRPDFRQGPWRSKTDEISPIAHQQFPSSQNAKTRQNRGQGCCIRGCHHGIPCSGSSRVGRCVNGVG